jgi:2,3-bisphosphoglycerate-dependent phosphoglycerate mutase
MKKEFHIYIFRHGQTDFNRDGKFTGWLDAKLTNTGKKQAKNVARKLAKKKFGVAFHTSLSRSKDTLMEVLRFHPECKMLIEDDRMIERNYGDLNGMTHEDFIEKIGKQEYNLLKEGDAIFDFEKKHKNKIQKLLGENEYKVIHRGYNVAPPKGESFADVEKRVKKFIKYLKKFIKQNKCDVAISAHGNSIRLFRKIMENASEKEATSWTIPFDRHFEYKIKVRI